MIIIIALLALCRFSFHLFANAHTFDWAQSAGGVDKDYGYSVAVDDYGNSYVTGSFEGTATFGETVLTSSGETDIFVAKLDASGAWQWAVRAGGTSWEYAYGIAVTPAGTAYITGSFAGEIIFGGLPARTSHGSIDIFVAKINTNGVWAWATQAGGFGADRGYDIALDNSNNSYVTGYHESTAHFGTTSISARGSDDIFVAKLDDTGSWIWAKGAGSTGDDQGIGIDVSPAGNCYITGYFNRTARFTVTNLTSSGSDDIFIAKLNSWGDWQWAKAAGGTARDRGEGIAIDSFGNCYVTGYYNGTASFGDTDITAAGSTDIFVTKLVTDGNWRWVTGAGDDNNKLVKDIASDSIGNCFLTGVFWSNTAFDEHSLISAGLQDIFVAHINKFGAWQWAQRAGGAGEDWGRGIDIDNHANCYVTGYFRAFNASFGSTILSAAGPGGWEDVFVTKLVPAYDFPPYIPIELPLGGEQYIITVIDGAGLDTAETGTLPPIYNDIEEYISYWLYGTEIVSFTVETARSWGAVYFNGQWHAYERNDETGLILFNQVDFGTTKGSLPIIFGDENPTLPVELSFFTAIFGSDMQVNLQWVAESETNHLGYNVLRSEVDNLNAALRINPDLIDEGTPLGSQISYSYVDAETMPDATYYYWLESLSLAGESEYFGPVCLTLSDPDTDDELPQIPLYTRLLKAFPNPFNPRVNIRYSLAEAASVRIEIFNFKGQKIKTLQNQHSTPGYYSLVWDGRDSNGNEVGSGVYLYRMNSGGYNGSGKLSLIK